MGVQGERSTAAHRVAKRSCLNSCPAERRSQPVDGDEQAQEPVRALAVIDEANCIGCTNVFRRVLLTPLWAQRAMHTVVADLCTGCNLAWRSARRSV
ncbi:MAG: hypothetical protein ACLR9W_03985 [Enterobacter hormaechei]